MTADPRPPRSPGLVFPGDMPTPPDPSWKVGVVSDVGAADPDRARAESGISQDAALIELQSGLRCVATALTAASAEDLAAQLQGLPLEVGAVFLTRTAPTRAGEAQRILAEMGGRPLLSSDDATAIAVTAAVLTYLTRLNRPLFSTRVVIAGAATMPVLCPMLLTAGIFDITLWNASDPGLPLARVVRDADAVVNLLGTDPEVAHAALDRPDGSVIGIGKREPLLALPGLFRAIAGAPGPLVEIQSFCAAARGLMHATPRRRLLPRGHSPELTYQVAHAVSRVLNPAYPRWPVSGYSTATGGTAQPERLEER